MSLPSNPNAFHITTDLLQPSQKRCPSYSFAQVGVCLTKYMFCGSAFPPSRRSLEASLETLQEDIALCLHFCGCSLSSSSTCRLIIGNNVGRKRTHNNIDCLQKAGTMVCKLSAMFVAGQSMRTSSTFFSMFRMIVLVVSVQVAAMLHALSLDSNKLKPQSWYKLFHVQFDQVGCMMYAIQ
jgi:hypothetical protein